MNDATTASARWQEARAPDGRTYYYNTITKETSWQKPPELMSAVDRALAAQPWKEHTAPDGRKYFAHAETKQTTWEMPDSYRQALNSATPTPSSQRPATNTPTFVSASSSLTTYQPDQHFEKRDFPIANGISVPVTKEIIPDYSSFAEAEAAFLKLLRRSNVQPDWSWEQAMRATIKDPQYRALKDPKDRKAAFEKYTVEVRQQESERAKERLAKLRTDFSNMLKTHPEIKHYSKWKTIRPIIERETVFRAADNESERKQLFEEHIVELKKQHVEQEASQRKQAIADLRILFQALDLEPYTRWSQAQEILAQNERMQNGENLKALSKSDILTSFEDHIKSLERVFNDARQQQKASRARRERQNRDQFGELLQEKRASGQIKAGTKWSALLPVIDQDPRYIGMLGQAGSTPLDLFWDVLEEEERALRGRRNNVYDVLEEQEYEVTTNTSFDEFLKIMLTDRRTANIDHDALQLIFQRIYEKVLKRNEDERHAADRHRRRAVDALRSRIKHLDPPVHVQDTWDQVRPRIEKFEEYKTLESDELRKSAFDKVVKRLKEKEEDAEKDRERRRLRHNDDRERRNGHRDSRSGRLSKSPEPDPYEADRRKAMAARERQYRKTSVGLSPPPSYRGHHDRDERYGRLDRSSPPRHLSAFERERREREDERERMYRTRADPRGARDELNYGDDSRSAAGSDRRRRRGDSDAGSVDSGRRSKRYRRDSRERKRTKTPEVKKEIPEPAGVHSGSEEGEIEED